jgi:hypothetical protein
VGLAVGLAVGLSVGADGLWLVEGDWLTDGLDESDGLDEGDGLTDGLTDGLWLWLGLGHTPNILVSEVSNSPPERVLIPSTSISYDPLPYSQQKPS